MKLFRNMAAVALLSLSTSAFADILTTLTIGPLPTSVNYGQTYTGASLGVTFYDDYYFTIPTGSVNSVTSSINLDSLLGLTNMQARLYMGTTHQTGAVVPGTLLSAWGTTVNYSPTVSATTVVLNPLTLAAGSYTLQIRGTVSGTSGGSYAGVLNLANPVPEPETYAMLLAGLGFIGFTARRKNKTA